MNVSNRRSHKGLTLIELMVALTLGLFLLGGILHVFSGSRQASRTNEALARVQESGRFALEFLAYDVRNAGYKGSCLQDVNNLLNETHASYVPDFFDLDEAIRGWDNTAGTHAASLTGYVAGTDVLLLRHAATASPATASGNTPANANTINLNGPGGIPQNAIVLVADPEGCDLFQNRSNSNANTLSRGNTGVPGNKNPGSFDFSHPYGPGMEILMFQSHLYYVGEGAAGVPSLRRLRIDSAPPYANEELVEGVQDMQILYGVDTTGNRRVDNYVAASAFVAPPGAPNWRQVISVRVNLLAVSDEENVTVEPQTVVFNGGNVAIPSNRLAQVFSSTIGIRNRLP